MQRCIEQCWLQFILLRRMPQSMDLIVARACTTSGRLHCGACSLVDWMHSQRRTAGSKNAAYCLSPVLAAAEGSAARCA